MPESEWFVSAKTLKPGRNPCEAIRRAEIWYGQIGGADVVLYRRMTKAIKKTLGAGGGRTASTALAAADGLALPIIRRTQTFLYVAQQKIKNM